MIRPLLLLLALLSPLHALAAAELVGRIATLVGTAEVVRAETGQTEPLHPRMLIYRGDTLSTDLGSHLKLLLDDQSLVKLGPESRMRVDQLQQQGKGDTEILLARGRLRSVVSRRTSADSHYRIRTSVAVSGVRGTDHEVLHIPPSNNPNPSSGGDGNTLDLGDGVTAVRTFLGLVQVNHSNPQIGGSVLVLPNTFTLLTPRSPPIAPQPIAPGEDLGARLQQMGGAGGGGEEPDSPAADEPPPPTPLDEADQGQLPPPAMGELSNPTTLPPLPTLPQGQGVRLPPGSGGGDEDPQLSTLDQPLPDAQSVPLRINIPAP